MPIVKPIAGSGGTDTSDATAEQWDIKSGKTAYIASGSVVGTGYFPAAMQFDGSTGYYSKTSVSFSGNKATLVFRFSRASFTGNKFERMVAAIGGAGRQRAQAYCFSSDYSDADRAGKIQIFSTDSAGATVCALVSPSGYLDGNPHTLLYAFDGDAGTATFIIDGDDADDSGNADRVAPTTGTLDSTSGGFGAGADSAGNNKFGGQISFCGYRDAYLTTWSDFMQTDGTPKPLDESTWAEWGAQPLFWHEAGKMDENLGSAGAMTANGTITLASAQ